MDSTAATIPTGIARVLIQLKTRSLDHPFDYCVPGALAGAVRPGAVVLVPFGRQKALGIVSGLAEDSDVPASKLVDIEQVLDFPPVPEALIRLALWISDYYYCSPAVAMGLVLPPGGLPGLERQVRDGEPRYSLKEPQMKPRLVQFARLAAGVAGTNGEVDAAAAMEPAGAADVSPDGDGSSEAQRRVRELLHDTEAMPVAELCRRAGVSRSPVQTLARHGELELFEAELKRSGARYYGLPPETAAAERLQLNADQEKALAVIRSRMGEESAERRSRPVLLMGVAGAGKTEIYLRAIEEAVALGRRAIVLVPEISLTHQAVKRFRRRFGERVGILHSGLGAGERYDEYRRVRDGSVDVVIGPRSALFAPLPDLGLIIIDEENDGSYKQENEPRYDARRVALERARMERAALVYGSATPSLESYYRISDRFYLPERATGASMPQVEIVDMRGESDMVFSRRLLEELDRTLAAGGKSILLLNRRGYAGYLQCGQCGHIWQCHNCDISLTVHSRDGRLSCHHCGFSMPMPDICSECGSPELRRWGIGTERLERELGRRFPEAKLFRLDADTASGYGEGPRILERFAGAERAVLLGTQMVAKGHHFPEVTLAAVINADLALQFPEFRAEEQTFAILQQLSGRSGRAELPGKVLIQTWNADIECIRMAAEQGTDAFYEAELERRRRLGYPPFKQLINIVCLSGDGKKVQPAASFLKEKLEPVTDGEQVLGPADLFRVQGWSRSQLLVKTDSVERTLAAFGPVIESYRGRYRSRGVRIIVDVDPQWLS